MINSAPLIAIDYFIENHTKSIKGIRAISDIDIAFLFDIKVGYLLKRIDANLIRFPDDFMIILSENEQKEYNCKRVAFTLEGLFMVTGILKSQKAVKLSINLVELLVDKKPGFIFNLINEEKSKPI